MKKVTGIQTAIKYLLLAIILGGISGNLLCVLEGIASKLFQNFGVLVLLMSSILTGLIYFLFIREKKTIYAVAGVPSALCFMGSTMDFWEEAFHLHSEGGTDFFMVGTVMFFYAVLYLTGIMVLAILLIRWILIRREKLLDFRKIEEGYCVELSGLSFVCDGRDKDYQKSVQALANAYYREKEKEIITYMIHQEGFIRVYGEMTEEEMLEKMEDMPFFPYIFLHREMYSTITFEDETHTIEISFEGIFENLCNLKIRDQGVSPVDKKQPTC